MKLEEYQPYVKKVSQFKHDYFGPDIQEWEDEVWNDLIFDPSGNVKRRKSFD